MNLQRLSKTAILLFSMLLSINTFAAEQWYQVEMIIFGQNHSITTVREEMADNTFIPDSLTAVKLSPEGLSHMNRRGSVAFKLLAENHFILKHHYNKIQSNPTYTPVMHIAWRQPVAYRKKGFKVKIEGGKVFVDQGNPGNNENGNDNQAEVAGTQGSKQLREVSGTVVVKRSRYLHIKTDLLYRNKATASGQVKTYRMKGSRRMKSKELHYIDHPMFGMLVYIRGI